MSAMSHPMRSSRRLMSWHMAMLFVVPVTLLALLAIAFLAFQFVSSKRVDAHLSAMIAKELPIDDATMAQWFYDNTAHETTVDWHEINSLASILESTASGRESSGLFEVKPDESSGSREKPFDGEEETRKIFAWPRAWADEAAVGPYLEKMAPVLERIEKTPDLERPVWQPIAFHGWHTDYESLQASRTLIRVLRVEHEHAVFHSDSERALRALRNMRKVNKAFDWRLNIVCELIHLARLQLFTTSIRRTMRTNLWNEEQLMELQQWLAEDLEIEARWSHALAGERGMLLAQADRHESDIYVLDDLLRNRLYETLTQVPSWQIHYLRTTERASRLADNGIEELMQRTADWERQPSKSLHDLLAFREVDWLLSPSLEHLAFAYGREELMRRMTRTSVAVKQYHLKYQRWPTQLTELHEFGLEPRDWSGLAGDTLGYETSDNEAFIWGADMLSWTTVQPTPKTKPKLLRESEQIRIEWQLTPIR